MKIEIKRKVSSKNVQHIVNSAGKFLVNFPGCWPDFCGNCPVNIRDTNVP